MRSSLTAARKEVAPEGLQRQGRSHLTKRLPGSTAVAALLGLHEAGRGLRALHSAELD